MCIRRPDLGGNNIHQFPVEPVIGFKDDVLSRGEQFVFGSLLTQQHGSEPVHVISFACHAEASSGAAFQSASINCPSVMGYFLCGRRPATPLSHARNSVSVSNDWSSSRGRRYRFV